MTSDYYNERTKSILINKNPHGQYHLQNFTHYNYGDQTPINANIINNMPNAQIILSESVYESLQAVMDVTIIDNQEFPFFLYGKDLGNNKIEFNEFMSSSNNRQSNVASFNQDMITNLEKKITNYQDNNLVVCHGHSHPPIGPFHNTFSLKDLSTYMEMNQENNVFSQKQVELAGCLITSTGDFNFIFYDNINDNFFRFTNVVKKDKQGNYTPINCYSQPHQQTRSDTL